MAANTLELARQGDPAAIAVILTYHLSQRWNAVASAIRLGDYLSVLIDANFPLDPDRMIALVLSILSDLQIPGLRTVDISTRQMGDREVQWSQTIELAYPPTQADLMIESTSSDWLMNSVAPDAAPPTPDAPDLTSPALAPTDRADSPEPDGRGLDGLESDLPESDQSESDLPESDASLSLSTPGAPATESSAEPAVVEAPMAAIAVSEPLAEGDIAPAIAEPPSEAVVVPAVVAPQSPESAVVADADMAAAIAMPANQGAGGTAIAPEAAAPLSLSLVFQRPEIVALIAVAVVLVLWESYAEWLNEPDSTEVLSKGKLARRLGVSRKVIDRVKGRSDFSQWSQALDPEGLAWQYEHPVFVPGRSPLPARLPSDV